MQLICAFVFAYAKSKFSHDEAQLSSITVKPVLSDHIKQDIFGCLLLYDTVVQVVAYCCMKEVQKAHA